MRPNIIRQPLGLTISCLIIFLGVVTARAVLFPYPAEISACGDMPLGQLIDSIPTPPPLGYILFILFALLNSLLLTRVAIRYSVAPLRTYLPLLLYPLCAYAVFIPIGSLSAHVACTLMILSVQEMIGSFKRTNQFVPVFRSSLWIGTLTMIYSPAIALVIMIPLTLLLYERTAREGIVSIAGLATPFILCTFGWWTAGYDAGFIASSFTEALHSGIRLGVIGSYLSAGPLSVGLTVFNTLLILFSTVLALTRMSTMRTRVRKIYIHLILLLVATSSMLLIPSSTIIWCGMIAVPGSLLLIPCFSKLPGWITTFLFVFFLLFPLFINFLRIL